MTGVVLETFLNASKHIDCSKLSSEMTNSKLSVDEAELYDRQIRLWGIESQEKLRAASILLINARGLGSEIAKNIILSGVNSITFLDDGIVSDEDSVTNFLLTPGSTGKEIAKSIIVRAQTLNPLVIISHDNSSIASKDEAFFAQFSIVVATRLSHSQLLSISSICRKAKCKFIYGDNFGMFGFSLADLQEHQYHEDRVKFVVGSKRPASGAATETKTICATINYPSLEEVIVLPTEPIKPKRRNTYFYLMQVLLMFRDKFKRDPQVSTKDDDIQRMKEMVEKVCHYYSASPEKLNEKVYALLFGEVIPVCSIVGGVIAQEVIKAVSGKEVPIHNCFLLDPFSYAGKEECIV